MYRANLASKVCSRAAFAFILCGKDTAGKPTRGRGWTSAWKDSELHLKPPLGWPDRAIWLASRRCRDST